MKQQKMKVRFRTKKDAATFKDAVEKYVFTRAQLMKKLENERAELRQIYENRLSESEKKISRLKAALLMCAHHGTKINTILFDMIGEE